MTTSNKNLLLNLHKFAKEQNEDFITECFAHLLQILITDDAKSAIEIIRYITGSYLKLTVEDLKNLKITTQITTEEGSPDIEIRTNDHLIYIEVKVEAGFGYDQLKRYKRQLNNDSRYPNTYLIVLTRYPFVSVEGDEKPDVAIRWTQIGEWLENLTLTSETSFYVVSQFVEFLKGRGLAMDRVSWELVDGLRSFQSLMGLINEVLVTNNFETTKTVGHEYYGYYFEGKKFYLGMYYNEPHQIVFETQSIFTIDETENIEFGEIRYGRWYYKLDMQSEEHYFFARSKSSQMECLDQFLKKSLNYVRTLGR